MDDSNDLNPFDVSKRKATEEDDMFGVRKRKNT